MRETNKQIECARYGCLLLETMALKLLLFVKRAPLGPDEWPHIIHRVGFN